MTKHPVATLFILIGLFGVYCTVVGLYFGDDIGQQKYTSHPHDTYLISSKYTNKNTQDTILLENGCIKLLPDKTLDKKPWDCGITSIEYRQPDSVIIQQIK